MRDYTYPVVEVIAKTLFRGLGHKWIVTGREHVPRKGGFLLAVNHTGYVDFIYAGFAVEPVGRRVRFMAKKEIFDHKQAGPLMRSFHHIPVDRGAGTASVATAIDYLKRGECVGIYPEATLSRAMELKTFKTGAVRIAAEAGVPILPVICWGTQRMLTKDHPRDFSRGKTISLTVGELLHVTGEDPIAETAALHLRMSELLDQTIKAYPAAEQPPGSWWLPARYGGSAPTLAEAAEMDKAEYAKRAEKRAAREAAKKAKG